MRKLLITIGIILMIVPILFVFYIIFSNPDMTQIRLFFTFWKEIIICILIIASGYFVLYKGIDKN